MFIRPANAADIPSFYKICLQTADSGRDATPIMRYQDLIGDLYAVPYLQFSPETCLVAQQENQVVGYIVGVTNTASYNKWLNSHWLPELRQRYPLKIITKGALEQMVLTQIHRDVTLADFLSDYPSHFHINLLPQAQGQQFGVQLIKAFIQRIKAQGSNGLHLTASSDNPRAIRFYQRNGFQQIRAFEDAHYMGLNL